MCCGTLSVVRSPFMHADRGPKTLWEDQKKVDKGVIFVTVIRGLNLFDFGQRAIIE